VSDLRVAKIQDGRHQNGEKWRKCHILCNTFK